jgi:hypothetical protein
MLLFKRIIEHLFILNIGDVADKITSPDWWGCDTLQLADSELGGDFYIVYEVSYLWKGKIIREESCE